MAFLGEEDEEEVEIQASKSDETELKNEVESKFGEPSSDGSGSESVSLEDLHRQNERIISLLEDMKEDDTEDVGGAMDGVL